MQSIQMVWENYIRSLLFVSEYVVDINSASNYKIRVVTVRLLVFACE